MKVGVLDVQGDITEHLVSVEAAAKSLGLDVQAIPVRTIEAISSVSALIIPGGESTTVSMLMENFGLDKAIIKAAKKIPILGTCAGLVLLCKKGDKMKAGQSTLGLMDAAMVRNAWGRQVDSFEADLDIPLLGEDPYPGVFIRAPAIDEVWGGCESLAKYKDKTIFARQGNIIVTAFHPELTDDLRIHKMFLEMI